MIPFFFWEGPVCDSVFFLGGAPSVSPFVSCGRAPCVIPFLF